MARTIQVMILLCLAYNTNLLASVPSTLICTPTPNNQSLLSPKKLAALDSNTKSILLYKFAMSKAKQLISCQYETDSSGTTIIYKFNNSMALKNTTNTEIEYDSQNLSLLPSLHLSEKTAIELIKSIEHGSFGETGCGIDWVQPTVELNNHIINKTWWGDNCNCKGSILTKNSHVIQISFQTAC